MKKSVMDTDKLLVGKVNGFYGVKGWVKVFSYTQPKENILVYQSVLLKLNKQWHEVEIKGRTQGKGIVAHFAGYDDREKAQALLGSEIAIYREQLAKLAKDDYYWVDLIGLKVINTEDICLGVIKSMMETAANDVCVVKPDDKQYAQEHELNDEYLIPWLLEDTILSVDLSAGIIRVDWDKDF